MQENTLIGSIIAANPLNPRDDLGRSTVLIVTETSDHIIGLQLNYALETMTLSQLGQQVSMVIGLEDPIYFGGPMFSNKIHMIHTTDWRGLTTVEISRDLAITTDISVLAALSLGQGPEYYKACAGYWSWDSKLLRQQLAAKQTDAVRYRWESVPADLDLVFNSGSGEAQWRTVLSRALDRQVNQWFY